MSGTYGVACMFDGLNLPSPHCPIPQTSHFMSIVQIKMKRGSDKCFLAIDFSFLILSAAL